ncbi:MAG: helix-turn-helix transcriptional regulator [bacterium]|nr:helix-turn-helix transcriptional regulator [bacterium]
MTSIEFRTAANALLSFLSEAEKQEKRKANPDQACLERLRERKRLLTRLGKHPDQADELFQASLETALRNPDGLSGAQLSTELLFYHRLRPLVREGKVLKAPRQEQQRLQPAKKALRADKPSAVKEVPSADPEPEQTPTPASTEPKAEATLPVVQARRAGRPKGSKNAQGTAEPSTSTEPKLSHVFYGKTLAAQEWEVAQLIVAGLENAEIAEQTGRSVLAVGSIILNVMRVLGVSSREDLISKLRQTFPDILDRVALPFPSEGGIRGDNEDTEEMAASVSVSQEPVQRPPSPPLSRRTLATPATPRSQPASRQRTDSSKSLTGREVETMREVLLVSTTTTLSGIDEKFGWSRGTARINRDQAIKKMVHVWGTLEESLDAATRTLFSDIREKFGETVRFSSLEAFATRFTRGTADPREVPRVRANSVGFEDFEREREQAAAAARLSAESKDPGEADEEEEEEEVAASGFDLNFSAEELKIARFAFLTRKNLNPYQLSQAVGGPTKPDDANMYLNSVVRKVNDALYDPSLSTSPEFSQFLDSFRTQWLGTFGSIAEVIIHLTPKGQTPTISSIPLLVGANGAKPSNKPPFKFTTSSWELLLASVVNRDLTFNARLIDNRCGIPAGLVPKLLPTAFEELGKAREAEKNGEVLDNTAKTLMIRLSQRYGSRWEVDELIELIRESDRSNKREGVEIAV